MKEEDGQDLQNSPSAKSELGQGQEERKKEFCTRGQAGGLRGVEYRALVKRNEIIYYVNEFQR